MPITLDGTNGITLTGSAADVTLSNTSPLGTASAGMMEYDGRVPYFTPSGTQRGIIPGMQYYRLDSALVGSNATGAQNIFGVGVTLSSNTVYQFQGFWMLTKTAGVTSHTLSYGYGGTATNNNFIGNVRRLGLAQTIPITGVSAVSIGWLINNVPTLTVSTGANVNATFTDAVEVWGTISVATGGTFIPQYSLSAAPGGAYSTQINSWFSIYPIGAAGSNTSIGTWA